MTYYEQEVMRLREYFPCEAVLERCREARRLIDERCCTGVDLDELCGRMFVSKFHFIRQFNRVYGLTPHRYLTEQRIQAAKALLEEGLGVSAVCARVGFSSVPSFTAVFKRFAGCTPAAYGQMRNF